MFRRTLRRLLDVEETVSVIDEAADLPSAVGCVQRRRPRVLVLDLDMPNGSTIETIRRLRAQVPWTEIVVLTIDESALAAQQMLAAGAIAFVLKDRAETELLEAVRRAARGEEFVSARRRRIGRASADRRWWAAQPARGRDRPPDRARSYQRRDRGQAPSLPSHG